MSSNFLQTDEMQILKCYCLKDDNKLGFPGFHEKRTTHYSYSGTQVIMYYSTKTIDANSQATESKSTDRVRGQGYSEEEVYCILEHFD